MRLSDLTKKSYRVTIRNPIGKILYIWPPNSSEGKPNFREAASPEDAKNKAWFAAAVQYGYIDRFNTDKIRSLSRFKRKYSAEYREKSPIPGCTGTYRAYIDIQPISYKPKQMTFDFGK